MAVVLADSPAGEWTGYLRARARVDGAATAVHALALPRSGVAPRILQLDPPEPLAPWCVRHGVADAITGGFL